VPDEDCPTDMESMKFWCTVTKKATTKDAFKVTAAAKTALRPASAAAALGAGLQDGPSLLPVADAQALLASVTTTPAGASTPSPAPATPGQGWL
jgi:hypothetical protein